MEADVQPLLTSKEVGVILDVSPSTLSRWREDGRGPRFLNLNGIIRYMHDDVREYIDGNRT
ncbi:helix-turn-helix domain-containing protein [Microbacterium lushaniae]|nr:helix-turn-helix domain-containing protein [Microbacterium lushaniae]